LGSSVIRACSASRDAAGKGGAGAAFLTLMPGAREEALGGAFGGVADDALAHKKTIDLGITAVTAAEKEALAQLRKIDDAKPKDIARYDFVLKDAIQTTEDSLELNGQDPGQRARSVEAKEKSERAARQAAMAPEEPAADGAKSDDKKADDQKTKRKPPTLRRPGEPPIGTPAN
jgi:hypothetical protein